jgi:hypothetical protein
MCHSIEDFKERDPLFFFFAHKHLGPHEQLDFYVIHQLLNQNCATHETDLIRLPR